MSRIFYDHLVVLEEIEVEIGSIVQTSEEKEELWRIVDEIVHHRVLGTILTHLPVVYHQEFLTKFHSAPYDTQLIVYLNEKSSKDIEKEIKKEIKKLKKEILQEIKKK